MADEFVLTPAAWLQPASLFTPTPKAGQRVLEFSARRSITITRTRARLISTPRAAFRARAMPGIGQLPTPKPKTFSYNKRAMDRAMGPFYQFWQFLESITHVINTPNSSTPAASAKYFIINELLRP
jgi:hypothetical protein